MKKLFSVFVICSLIAFTLSSCAIKDTYQLVSGQITGVQFDRESGYPMYTVLTSDKGEVGIAIDEETTFGSWMEDVDAEKLRTGEIESFDGIIINADYDISKIKPLSKGGEYVTVSNIGVIALLSKNVKTLADGTAVDMWRNYKHTAYQLSDGTELLYVYNTSGPENVYVANTESFDDLPETAKTKVMEYYSSRGLLYDTDAYLEQAYKEYKTGGNEFNSNMLQQSVSPSASNDKIICFMTSVTTPVENKRESTESRYGEIFDKTTGEHISGYDIFTCEREQIITTILENGWGGFEAEISDTEKAEIRDAFNPNYIILRDEGMDIAFPKGSLPSQEHTYILSVEYNDAIKSIMQPWAIPNQSRG